MNGAEEDNRRTPRGAGARVRAGGLRLCGPRWVVSLRALVVVLAMLAAALGMLWLEAAGVEGVSAGLATKDMGKVAVPPLEPATSGGPPTSGRSRTTGLLQESPQPAAVEPPAPEEALLLVHVAGAVASPGVVSLAPGSRVYQAINAAGGALPAAALSALNLAAPLEDGQQVLVPSADEAALLQAPGGSGAAAGGRAAAAGGVQRSPPQPLNINTATAAELETLPGIGPVLAGRIVTWRDDHGPFQSVDALDAVSGIGAKMLAGIRDLVRVA